MGITIRKFIPRVKNLVLWFPLSGHAFQARKRLFVTFQNMGQGDDKTP